MGAVKDPVRVVDGGGFAVRVRRQPPLVVGYDHFRLDRQGQLLSPKTLIYYDDTVLPFLRWLEAERATLRRGRRRADAHVSSKPRRKGRKVRPAAGAQDDPGVPPCHPLLPSLGSPRGLRGRWTDPRAHRAPRAGQGTNGLTHPAKEDPCRLQPRRTHVGPGGPDPRRLRSPPGGALRPDGRGSGRPVGRHDRLAEQRTCGAPRSLERRRQGPQVTSGTDHSEAGRRHQALRSPPSRRYRSAAAPDQRVFEPYQGPGIKSMMDRITRRVGFRVHAHAFRHTFATVAAKDGVELRASASGDGPLGLWNAAALRAAGHRTRPWFTRGLGRSHR